MSNEEQTPEQVVMDSVRRWLTGLEVGEQEKAGYHLNTWQRIDPNTGELEQGMVILVKRQMERVNPSESGKLEALPPIPPPPTAPET